MVDATQKHSEFHAYAVAAEGVAKDALLADITDNIADRIHAGSIGTATRADAATRLVESKAGEPDFKEDLKKFLEMFIEFSHIMDSQRTAAAPSHLANGCNGGSHNYLPSSGVPGGNPDRNYSGNYGGNHNYLPSNGVPGGNPDKNYSGNYDGNHNYLPSSGVQGGNHYDPGSYTNQAPGGEGYGASGEYNQYNQRGTESSDDFGNKTVGFDSSQLDMFSLIMMLQEERVGLLDSQVKEQSKRMQGINSEIKSLGETIGKVNQLSASLKEGDDKVKLSPEMAKELRDQGIELPEPDDKGWGPAASPEVTKDQLNSYAETLKSKRDGLNNDSQMEMIRLQGLINKQQQAYQLMTTIQKKEHDMTMSTISKMS